MHARSVLVASLLLLAGCSKWNVIQEKDTAPLEGQTKFILLPLSFDSATIEELPEPKWLSEQDAEQKAAWAGEKDFVWKAFQKSATENLEGHATLFTAENPGGATITLKPRVIELEPGGYSKVVMIVGLQVLDPNGNLLEEISTTAKVSGRDEFKVRLAAAAEVAAENVARYVRKRTGK